MLPNARKGVDLPSNENKDIMTNEPFIQNKFIAFRLIGSYLRIPLNKDKVLPKVEFTFPEEEKICSFP